MRAGWILAGEGLDRWHESLPGPDLAILSVLAVGPEPVSWERLNNELVSCVNQMVSTTVQYTSSFAAASIKACLRLLFPSLECVATIVLDSSAGWGMRA